jgi:Fe-S-cluster formation regulator IscX/YfhJ
MLGRVLIRKQLDQTTRLFCSGKTLGWSSGIPKIAEKLFQKYTVEVDEGPRCDPRGMRPFELKKKLKGLDNFEGDLQEISKYHVELVAEWQKLYDSFMNGNVKLPGRDPAGPLTFHHDADKSNVRMLYDKHGRVEH